MKSKRHSVRNLTAVVLFRPMERQINALSRITGSLIGACGAGLSASPTP